MRFPAIRCHRGHFSGNTQQIFRAMICHHYKLIIVHPNFKSFSQLAGKIVLHKKHPCSCKRL